MGQEVRSLNPPQKYKLGWLRVGTCTQCKNTGVRFLLQALNKKGSVVPMVECLGA